MTLESTGNRVPKEVAALGINIACDLECAKIMSSNNGLKMLMTRALKTDDVLLLKMVHNLARHKDIQVMSG